jgi:SNF2-related domain
MASRKDRDIAWQPATTIRGILTDDMGLGKTVQALAHILVEKREGRLDQPCLGSEGIALHLPLQTGQYRPRIGDRRLEDFMRGPKELKTILP